MWMLGYMVRADAMVLENPGGTVIPCVSTTFNIFLHLLDVSEQRAAGALIVPHHHAMS